MEEYPEEFRTPPLPLVALIGLPEFHLQVTHYLRAEQPPLATVSIPEAVGAASLAGKERRPPDARLPSPLGVLKAGWLAKHRQRAASVAVAFFAREKIFGDPSQWLSVCTQIDAIKAAIRGRNIKVVIAIAQATAASLDASEERLQALRKRAETEARCCVPFVTGDVAQLRTSLANLAKLVGELAATYYREEGRRIKTRIEKKAYSSPELSVRYNFKIAVYAEFRRDWVAAVKYYNAAYTLLHEVPTPPQELQPVQRLVEAKSVAEILHLKLVTLLLHSGNTLEAVTQLRRHLAWYRAREGPPEGAFLHWAWVSKQYKVFGELLQSRLAVVGEKPPGAVGGVVAAVTAASATGGEREQQPAVYFQLAAACAIKRRQAFESALSIAQAFGDLEQEDVLSGVAEKIGPPLYIGQAPRILNRGSTPETQRPTEAEFVRHALLQERHVAHSQLAIALLTRAHDQYKRLPHAGRIIYQLGGEMADEYLHASDLSNARRLYDSVAALYRKESWALLLAATLERLRECTRKGGLVQAFVEYSLELASLPLNGGNDTGNGYESTSWDGGKGVELRKHAQGEAMAILAGSGLKLDRIDSGAEEEDLEGKSSETFAIDPAAPVLLTVADASPLRTVLSCTALFDQRSAQPGTPTKLTVVLLSRLPSPLIPMSIEVVFSDPACNVTLTASQPVLNLMDDATAEPAKESVRGPEELTLNPLEWRKLSIDVTPTTSGRLECQACILTLGPNSRLRCQVESLVGGEILVPFWMFEPQGGGSPFPKPLTTLGGARVLEVGEAPADIDVQVDFGGEPGLVGEVLPVRILVSSRGNKVSGGKLSLELVSLAPQPPAAVSDAPLVDLGSEVPVVEVLPAELLVGMGSEGAERQVSDVTSDSAEGAADPATSGEGTAAPGGSGAYEKFSGQLAIPEMDAGGEWAAVVFLRWAQAADAGLAVTESYEAEKGGGAPRKSKVRKVVPMRGEEPLSVSHRWFAPFRKDALLPAPSTASAKLPTNEEVLLSVSVQSSSSVPVRVSGLALRLDQNLAKESGRGTAGQPGPVDLLADSTDRKGNGGRVLGPGEAFARLFRVRPLQPGESVSLGALEVTWQRHVDVPAGTWESQPAAVVSVLPLAPVSVESPHVVVETELPACATLGKPFSVAVRVTNATELLQEVAYSVTDSPSFVLGGSHNGQMIVLPRSVKALMYELVPIQAGLLTLPQIKFGTIRHGAKLNPTQGNAKIFVYPSSSLEGSGQSGSGNSVYVAVR